MNKPTKPTKKPLPKTLNEDGVVVATDEEIDAILKEISLDELDEGDLSPTYPGGIPYLVLANKYIPYDRGLILVQEARVRKEIEKLENMKAQ